MFSIFTFVLNEAKFLPYAIKSWLESPLVSRVAVVEGCVRLNETADVTEAGLSTDGTGEAVRRLQREHPRGKDVSFEQIGWVADKAVLQNRGLQLLRLFQTPWVIIAGGDELYKAEDLEVLAEACRATKANVVTYPFYHFWRRPDVVAKGSSWDVWMHRCYRVNPGMRFKAHNAPPTGCGGTQAKCPGCHVYHYVGMKDKPTVDAKVAFYKKRDGHRLKVQDTWTDWRWGDKTQWTHSGGSAERFKGEHPSVIASEVWQLLPRDSDGRVMPVPRVPWDVQSLRITTDAQALQQPGLELWIGAIARIIPDVKIYAVLLDDTVAGIPVSKFDMADLFGAQVVVSCSPNVRMAPRAKVNVALRFPSSPSHLSERGYVMLDVRDLPEPNMFCAQLSTWLDRPPTKKEKKKPAAKWKEPVKRGTVTTHPPVAASRARRTVDVQIKNRSKDVWRRKTHRVGARWVDSVNRQPITGSPRTTVDLPHDVRPGETLKMTVPVPRNPSGMSVGLLYLKVDIFDGRDWLNCGVEIFVRLA